MKDNLDDYLVGIVIGIRFRQNYSIIDQFGAISDLILYSDDSFFIPKIFPKRQILGNGKLILYRPCLDENINENNLIGDRLIFDHENTILEMSFIDNPVFTKADLGKIIESFEKQIVKGVLKKFNITGFTRIGYIKRYMFKDEKLINSFLNCTPGVKIGKINDLSLRFSQILGDRESLIDKKNNYYNVIYTVTRYADPGDELNISIDYQKFYEPHISDSTHINFKKFIGNANEYNSNKFLSWLDNYYEEPSDESKEVQGK